MRRNLTFNIFIIILITTECFFDCLFHPQVSGKLEFSPVFCSSIQTQTADDLVSLANIVSKNIVYDNSNAFIEESMEIFVENEAEEEFIFYEIPIDFVLYNNGCLGEDIQKYIKSLCQKYNIDYSLILAMIEIESGYNPNEYSSSGAVGYMQMLKLGITDVSDPYQNILLGIDYISELISLYGTEKALM